MNPILLTDSYKPSHWKQYPAGTERVFSFLESRGGQFPSTIFFGLQYILKKHLIGAVVTEADIAEARDLFRAHFGTDAIFNEAGWRYIVDRHGGRLPVRIRAVPEGTAVPVSNVLMTIENTDPAVPWITNYLETLTSQAWYPTTVATQSNMMRRTVLKFLEETGSPDLIDFKVHDFGYRGSTSVESAGIGGAAHLVNFKGTDTLAAIITARDYYDEPMAGFSIPAAEHSTITSWGKDRERDAYGNMLEQFPDGLVAVVSDSYDIYRACRDLWGKELREQVLNRNGTVVVRPDSGNPPEVVLKVLQALGDAFGTSVNEKGYRVLDPHVRVIQGDGIDLAMLDTILTAMQRAKWSADNIAFGSGGGLLQKVNRDTSKFAIKCSAIHINGMWRDVMKDPITDPGKRSKAGRLKLIRNGHGFETVREESAGDDELVTVFENGELVREYSFQEIRDRATKG
ncbi:MAG: nicotinate phosphoribosyltransferase [Candidatus Yonathbacteria bacterium RIFOXYC1_FULL_52_10]|uniref:Nicotinamide phosphoribosyltransferase n=1 Tax=Candidatus Yonathbacteria bacterium RIFOXYD1_FULL_52_36 TaxID=1802730 RepID=A0A1G2SMN3_9BACT|nr:MAG: nicotinate phosphoribosyltransferase [Candidatus Yonathbacteria bacterium RIFOXYC1_FULL_52_10]OHA86052.1 MAG: nicotinate phosphoribosyltransferase [Candidatus Yonathbacteria bacterium RIFOXYD1_FULL_52_36]